MASRGGRGNQTTVPHLPVPPARPPGLWLRAAVDYPRPLTPFTSAWLLPGLSAASRPALQALGAMIDRVEYREIDGSVYRRVVPFGPTRRPAALFRPIAKALVRVRSSTRQRLNLAIHSMRSRSYEEALDRWDGDWCGRLRAGAPGPNPGDLTALDDRALDQQIETAVRLSQEGVRIYAQVAFAASIAIGRFIRDCRDAGVGEPPIFNAITPHAQPVGAGTAADETADPAAAESASWFPLGRDAAVPIPAELGLAPSPMPTVVSKAGAPSVSALPMYAPDPVSARRAHAAMRDVTALALDRPLALVRPPARELGHRLAEREQIGSADDVFMLTPDEARAALRSGEVQHERVAGRRPAYEQAAAAKPSATLGSAPNWPLDLLPGDAREMVAAILAVLEAYEGRGLDATAGGHTGATPGVIAIGVAPSVATGSVRLLREVADLADLQPGDVAVCRSASYALAPFVPGGAALVAASGGPLSPVADVARALGIPAVAGYPIESLADGERVEVDGDAGSVRRVVAQAD